MFLVQHCTATLQTAAHVSGFIYGLLPCSQLSMGRNIAAFIRQSATNLVCCCLGIVRVYFFRPSLFILIDNIIIAFCIKFV